MQARITTQTRKKLKGKKCYKNWKRKKLKPAYFLMNKYVCYVLIFFLILLFEDD